MSKTRNIARSIAFAVAAAPGLFQSAQAVTDEDLRELREQLRQLKQQYESRIEALEKRLQQAERASGQAAASVTAASTGHNMS